MSNGAIYTKTGFNALLNRGYKATPDYLAPTRFGIGTSSTTPLDTDTTLNSAITAWSGGSDYKNFVSGYPTFDTTNQKVTVQGFIASTEANGNVINEYGDFNADGSPIMSSRIVFNPITKTSAVQIYITTTYKRG
jgi:hypothetical protein